MRALLANLSDFFRRWPYCVACTIVALIFGGASIYWMYAQDPDLRKSLERRTEETSLNFRKKNGRAYLEQQLAELKEKTKLIEAHLVEAEDLASNTGYFYRIEELTKAQLLEFHQTDSPALEKAGGYRRVPYVLRVLGSFEQVSAFLHGLETGERFGRVVSFNLARADPAAQTISLDLNVELLGKK